jgi:uncharacterized protein
LPRLRVLLLDTAGDATFRLAFFRDEEHRAVLRCGVTATLKLRCQRCLEALAYQVDTIGLLALVSGIDEGRRLPERYDPLIVGHEPIRPRDSIEDELLLALPHIPMHIPDACGTGTRMANLALTQAKGTGPFAVLAELKRRE